MFLYNLTLQATTRIHVAVYGNFSGAKAQEIAVSKGKLLELLRPDDNGRMQTVLSVEVFGEIRTLLPVRLTGGQKDYLVVGSDSGRIVILEYHDDDNRFVKVHEETYGKSGCRRIVPGQYLAADAKGRAVMVAAVEKQKLVYVLNRDSNAKLTISSPLEAHKTHTLVWATVGLDVGFENPLFACIEVEYDDEDASERGNKHLTFYELDLGLNHVVRKWTDAIDASANTLLAVPGDKDGPGGVLVCAENCVYYKNQGHADVVATLPRRRSTPLDAPLLVVAHATHKQKDLFFMLLQSECGDLYKLTLQYEADVVSRIDVHYFDTVPLAADIAVLKTGFLFVAPQFGGHQLYQFQGIGDSDDSQYEHVTHNGADVRLFAERPLQYLALIHNNESLCPTLACQTLDLTNEGAAQLYTLGGQGVNSAVRVLRHGLAVDEVAVAPLEANPNAVWTVKKAASDAHDSYLVVSFVNATLVLSIGGETVEEVADSGLLGTSPTLMVASIGDDSLLQAHPGGLRHVRGDGRVQEWKAPGRKQLQHAACNGRQAVVALSGGDLYYFELDALGQLSEVDKVELGKELACVALAPVADDATRARFVAVGDWDNTVQLLSLAPDTVLQPLGQQVVPAQPHTLLLVAMGTGSESPQLYLNIGLHNGVMLRTVVDNLTGELSDSRTRFMGTRPVRLFAARVHGKSAVLALSSRSWLCYNWQKRYHMTPLSYMPLEYAAGFSSEQCPEGIVAVSENTVRIVAFDRLGEMFNESEIPLRYTPRKFLVHPQTKQLIVLETDHNTESYSARAAHEDDFDADAVQERERVFGRPRAGATHWASCIRLLDATSGETQQLLELDNDEAALSLCLCTFASRGPDLLLVVGTAQRMTVAPRGAAASFLHVYRFVAAANSEGHVVLELLHKTQVDGIPGAVAAFEGRLLAGTGHTLRIYECGKKKLLRKCENRNFPTFITSLVINGPRIIVGDVGHSFLYVSFKKLENQFHIFADDPTPRWLTASCIVDYDTMAGGDKFGNVFLVRLPPSVTDAVDDDPTGGRHRWEQGTMNAAPHKAQSIMQYHVGELVTSIQRTPLVPGGADVLLYTTIGGGIGALVPFVSREDVDFFQHLEMHMRQVAPPLCGRDHMAYRSAYYPVQACIDGDLCEHFFVLEPAKQRAVAEELDRSVAEVMKKIEGQWQRARVAPLTAR